jgi:hypothetical protein
MSADDDQPPRSHPPRRRRWLVLMVCILLGPLLAEGYVRYQLFGAGSQIGVGICKPQLFADPQLEDEFWRLRRTLAGPPYKETQNFDPLVGWTNRRFRPETYDLWEAPDSERRPLLLYGASYANCVVPPEECFGALVEQSDLASDFQLLNYGVGGHGAGQTYLVVRETVERYVGKKPVAIIALVADSDFERCVLGFRSWPKPVLEWNGNRLEPRGPVESGHTFLANQGTGIRSYAWRYLLYGTDALPEGLAHTLKGTDARLAELHELIERIVLGLRDEFESREIEHFFLLCVSPRSLQHEHLNHDEMLLIELFEQHGIPYVHTRESTLAAQASVEEPLFLTEGPGRNHPTRVGNEHLFELIRDGIAGRYTKSR